MTHNHAWIVFSTIVDEGKLLVRCDCGDVGTVEDPSEDEWTQAFYAPSKPYPWTEPDRVETLPGWTTALHEGFWTVVADGIPPKG